MCHNKLKISSGFKEFIRFSRIDGKLYFLTKSIIKKYNDHRRWPNSTSIIKSEGDTV
jgi:hypothetical protein